LANILIFKFKRRVLSGFIISTLAAHLMQYIILLFIDFNKFSHISMSRDTLTFDKFFVIIPSALISILIVWLLKRKNYNLSNDLEN
jgi:ABC-type Fe3+-siderophore transport system permease subunit